MRRWRLTVDLARDGLHFRWDKRDPTSWEGLELHDVKVRVERTAEREAKRAAAFEATLRVIASEGGPPQLPGGLRTARVAQQALDADKDHQRFPASLLGGLG